VPNFMDLIHGGSLERNRHKIYGVCTAKVTDNKCPEGLYRVKVRYPMQVNGAPGGETSHWARIVTFGAGLNRGMYVLPEVGDEVLIAFDHGDIAHPFVIGSLWDGQENKTLQNFSDPVGERKFPNKEQDSKNNLRFYKSRAGHYLEFHDDKDDKVQRVSLRTKQGHHLLLDDKNGALKAELRDAKDENYLLLDTQNKKITLETKTGDMLIKAKNTIDIQCKTLNVKSDQETNFDAGSNWNMKAASNMKLTAGGTGNVEASGTMTIKGSTVNIN
jgi:uncharacterized protein involved in type VI secretion and phage assembly